MYKKTNGNLTKQGELNYSKPTNPNLLDNPNFKINQRGINSATGGNFAVDRWRGCYNVDSTGVTLHAANYFSQAFEREWFKQFNGKVMTLQVSANGIIYSGSALIGTSDGNHYDTDDFISYPFNVDIYDQVAATGNTSMPPFLRFFGNIEGHHIEWVKLEVGSTPTPFIPSNSATELLKCQRYYWKSQPVSSLYGSPCLISNKWDYSNYLSFDCEVQPPITMRTNPSLKVNGASPGEQISMRSTATGEVVTGTLMAPDDFSLRADKLYRIGLDNPDKEVEKGLHYEGTIELSADL